MSIRKKLPPILFIALIGLVGGIVHAGLLPPTPGVEVAPLDSTGKVPSQYLPAGASVPPALSNMTTNVISPVSYGGDKTGANDSTAAFAAMQAAFPLATYTLPAGTFKANLTLATRQVLRGAGMGATKLIPANTALPVVTVVQENNTLYPYPWNQGMGGGIYNLTIDGGQDHTAAFANSTSTTYTGGHGIYFNAGTATGEPHSSIGNYVLHQVEVTACPGHGVYLDGRGPSPNGSIYAQAAWLTIESCVITWNMGNGLRIEGVAHQTHTTNTLIEDNARGCPRPTWGNNRNERAQVLITSYGSTVGYPAKHSFDGSCTVQTGTGTFDNLSSSLSAGWSLYSAQSVSIRDCYGESNYADIWSASSTTNGMSVSTSHFPNRPSYGYALALFGCGGATISDNEFLNGAGTAIHYSTDASALMNISRKDNHFPGTTVHDDYQPGSLKGIKIEDEGQQRVISRSYSVTTTSTTVDLSRAKQHFFTMYTTTAFTVTNPKADERYELVVEQSSTPRTATWAFQKTDGTTATVHWLTGSPPVLSNTYWTRDVLTFFYRNNNEYYETAHSYGGAAPTGTVTSVSGTAGNGNVWSITNPTTTPSIGLSYAPSGDSNAGMVKVSSGSLVKASAGTDYQAALGFTPEDVANKDTDGTLASNSDTKYASQKAVKTYVDAHAGDVAITNDVSTNATVYPVWVAASTGNQPASVSSSKMSFNPSTGLLTAMGFSGPLTGNVTGNVTGSSGTCTGLSNVTNNKQVNGLSSGTTSGHMVTWGSDGYTVADGGAAPTGMTYPGSGIAVSTGSAWGTSKTAPSGTIVGDTDTQTLTGKRITQRVNTVSSSATPSINTDTTDIFTITSLAAAITSMTTNLSGTPTTGQPLIIRIKDNGTARAITWGTSFASRGATLPTTTVAGKYLYLAFLWNEVTSTWDCVAAVQEA